MARTNATSYDQPAVVYHHRNWTRRVELSALTTLASNPTPADVIGLFKLPAGLAGCRPTRARVCSSNANGNSTSTTCDIAILKESDDSVVAKLLEAASQDGLLDATDDAASSGLDAGEPYALVSGSTPVADTEYYVGLVWVAAATNTYTARNVVIEVEFTGTDD